MNLKTLWVFPITSIACPALLTNAQSIWNNEIRLASYQSYLSDEIANKAYDEFGISITYFENDREVLNGFKTGAYDLAIVSSSTLEEAINKKIVKPIDWEKLTSIPVSYTISNQNKFFSNSLFAPIINRIFSENKDLYKYGIPYFLSYLTFVYRGEKIESLDNASWGQLLKTVSQDSRFHSGNKNLPKIGLIEDEFTIFSISKLASQREKSNDNSNKDNFYSKYSELVKAGLNSTVLGSRSIFLNPNSALLSEMLSSGQLNGAFMYNGDALYTYETLKSENKEKQISDDFHVFEGNPRLWLLDNIAISSKISKEREKKVYEFLDKLLFKGVFSNSEGSSYKSSWAWQNFDFLKYTPSLQELHTKIKSLKSVSGVKSSDSNFDDLTIKLLFGTFTAEEQDKCFFMPSCITGKFEDCSIVFEKGLSDSQNLSLSLAFQRWKNNYL